MPKFYLTVHGVIIGRVGQDKVYEMLKKQGLSWDDIASWVAGVIFRGYDFIGENGGVVRIDYR